MKQILQNISTGETSIADVPAPSPKDGSILIKTNTSLISSGTEKMLVEFGKSSLINKARSQPDKVRMVIDKLKTDGILATYDSIITKLDQPIPLGYCNVGTVIDGTDTGFSKGTRVLSNGYHAEIVRVPKNLTVKIPEVVSNESASFTVLGAISLQGIRLIEPNIGENVVVIGLGVIGLLTVQILIANGCNVLAADIDQRKCDLAKEYGATIVNVSKESIEEASNSFTSRMGADSVIITASSRSNEVIHDAAKISKKRGKIVLIGVIGLDIRRDDFYEKELTFQVSCSYGPGRYDSKYEQQGIDYPFSYVRWTEKRNFEAILKLMEKGLIKTEKLISSEFMIDDALSAYESLNDKNSLGVLLKYKKDNLEESKVSLNLNSIIQHKQNNLTVSLIGSGNYAIKTLLPIFRTNNVNFETIVSSTGINSTIFGKKYNFLYSSSNISDVFKDNSDIAIIATQHNLHAEQAKECLSNGKSVYIEKPLALNHSDIDKIEKTLKDSDKSLMIGFNRRFSPHIKKMKSLLDTSNGPKVFIMTMNAGFISKDNWVQDKTIGGGRIIGEACHYFDLMRFLANSKIKSFNAKKVIDINNPSELTDDISTITLEFEDGSIGSVHYLANGNKSFPKERIEVFCEGKVLQLDNFRKLYGYGWKNFKKFKTWNQDKGQSTMIKEYIKFLNEGSDPIISHDEIFEIARLSVDIADMLG